MRNDDVLQMYAENPDGTVRKVSLAEFVNLYGDETVDTRRVAYDEIDGRYRVSTMFMGMNCGLSYRNLRGPLLYETMVFDGESESLDCSRYHTRAEALEGHADMLAKWRCEAYKNPNSRDT